MSFILGATDGSDAQTGLPRHEPAPVLDHQGPTTSEHLDPLFRKGPGSIGKAVDQRR